jgi:hypothetical protein
MQCLDEVASKRTKVYLAISSLQGIDVYTIGHAIVYSHAPVGVSRVRATFLRVYMHVHVHIRPHLTYTRNDVELTPSTAGRDMAIVTTGCLYVHRCLGSKHILPKPKSTQLVYKQVLYTCTHATTIPTPHSTQLDRKNRAILPHRKSHRIDSGQVDQRTTSTSPAPRTSAGRPIDHRCRTIDPARRLRLMVDQSQQLKTPAQT